MGICKKCGAALNDDVQFCAECGTPIDCIPEEESGHQMFHFQKGKMLGELTYKRTNTEVEVSSTALKVHQTVKRIFRKEREEEKVLSFSQIKSACVHVVLDFWDTLYAVVFAVLGLFQPVLFLLAAVCLWCGYGREIEILTVDGDKVKIPLALGKGEAKKLVAICSQQS